MPLIEQAPAGLKGCRSVVEADVRVLCAQDSNTNGAVLAEYFKATCESIWFPGDTSVNYEQRPAREANGCKTKVVGAPKTIDGDLKYASQHPPLLSVLACGSKAGARHTSPSHSASIRLAKPTPPW